MTTAQLKRETFHTSRLLDFASEKELVAQTGHRLDDWPLVIAKELLDNCIDACEDEGIAPEIMVCVDREGIEVTDNGPGLPASTLDGVLDFSVRTSSRLGYVSPTRGAQGNALKTVVMMPFVLSGEERRGRMDISSQGVRHEITVEVNQVRQELEMARMDHPDETCKKGTSIRLYWPAGRRPLLDGAADRILQILSDFTLLNPHLSLSASVHGAVRKVKATDTAWRKWLPSDPTSSHWYHPEDLERLIASIIRHEQDTKVPEGKTIRAFVSEFDGLSSTLKQKAVLGVTGMARMKVADLAENGKLRPAEVRRLLEAMRANSKPVKPKRLGIIGKDHLVARLGDLGADLRTFRYHRQMAIDEESFIPVVVEHAFAWLGKDSQDRRRFITGVNWSPGIVNPFRELGKAGESLDAQLERLMAGRREPVAYVIHLASPRAMYTDRGKSAIVIDGVEKEV